MTYSSYKALQITKLNPQYQSNIELTDNKPEFFVQLKIMVYYMYLISNMHKYIVYNYTYNIYIILMYLVKYKQNNL